MNYRCREIFVVSRFHGRKNSEIADEPEITEKALEARITTDL